MSISSAIDASKKAHNEARVALDQYSAANEDYDGEWETDKTAWEEAHPDMTTDEIETLQMDKDAELSAAPEISPEVIRQIRHRDQRVRHCCSNP